MAVPASALPTLPTGGSPPTTEPARDAEWWIAPLAWAALAVFVAVPVFAYFVQSLAGRVVWSVVVAALRLFIVLVGYLRRRRPCPLPFFAELPVRLRRPATRRASEWLEDRSCSVAFSVFFLSL